MLESGSRKGAVNVSLVLAIVAIVAIGGLIYWLEATAVPTQVEVVDEEEPDADENLPTDVPVVTVESVRSEMEEYVGLELAIRNETVNSLLGSEGLWVGPEDNPFLVQLDETAAARTAPFESGDRVHLRGTIHAMSDSVLDAWEEEGAISGEGDRAVASFSDFFLEASEVDVLGGERDDGDDGDGGNAGGAQNGGGD